MPPINRRDFVRTALGSTAALSMAQLAARAAEASPKPPIAPVPRGPAGVVRADLSRAQPAGGLTRDFARNRWQIVDYETAEGVKGCMVFARPDDEFYKNKSYVCDVDTWISEGLVDYVIPSQRIDLPVLRRWRRLSGDRVHLWPDLMPRSQPPAAYTALAESFHGAGADGFSLWDGERRQARLTEWAAVRQLGHRERYRQIVAQAPAHFRSIPLATLGGLSAQDSFRDG